MLVNITYNGETRMFETAKHELAGFVLKDACWDFLRRDWMGFGLYRENGVQLLLTMPMGDAVTNGELLALRPEKAQGD